jgi:hypothetical protein
VRITCRRSARSSRRSLLGRAPLEIARSVRSSNAYLGPAIDAIRMVRNFRSKTAATSAFRSLGRARFSLSNAQSTTARSSA